MVNLGDAVGLDEWRELPIDEQMSWRIPMSIMLNMTLLRSTQPVITVAEYLRLHGLSEHLEESNGHWGRQKYHLKPYIFDDSGRTPSLHVIENAWYHPRHINRIDVMTDDMKKRGEWNDKGGDPLQGEKGSWPDIPKTSLDEALQAALPDWPKLLDWDKASKILHDKGYIGETHGDEVMERILNENGWEVLYTYSGP